MVLIYFVMHFRFGRTFNMTEGFTIEDYTVFYIGGESLTLTNHMMTYNKCQVRYTWLFGIQIKWLTRSTCTQQPLARLPYLFSVITVILLIDMPIPFKFDSCENFATNLNAANSFRKSVRKSEKVFKTQYLLNIKKEKSI